MFLLSLTSPTSHADVNVWMTTEQFLESAFADSEYQSQVLWITPELRTELETALDRGYAGIRIRYWSSGSRSAWILEQIGKERLITAGFVTEDHKLVNSKVLEYRESRGGEVRYDSFLNQFKGAELNTRQELNADIDGVTGATLSVQSMREMATAALVLEYHHSLSLAKER